MSSPDIPARRPVEPFDTLMYRGESDPRARSTLIGLFILDRAPDWDRLVRAWERITRLILPLRQKVVEPAIPVTAPMWVVDPDFDLAYHLRRVRLPAPGTQRQLLEFLEPIAMSPLDRTRPLWEYTLVEGLEGGGAAWVTKMNHAIADGVGGQELAHLCFDTERDAAPAEMPPLPAPDDLTPGDLVREALSGAPAAAVERAVRGAQGAARLGSRFVREPRRTLSDAAAYLQSMRRIMGGPGVEPSPLLRHRGLRRRLLVLEFGLSQLKEASAAAGGSLNDGFLAAVCAGLRLYHEQLGTPVDSVPIAIPINLRTEHDPAGGNRWTGAQLAPPVGEKDPAERIRRIRELVQRARQEPALDAFSAFASVAVNLPPWLLSAAFGNAAPDLQVSNVPGSPVPLYLAGAKVEKLFPFGPVPGPAAMITLNSYAGRCFVGINADPAAITEPERFATCLEHGVDEVLALRRRGRRSTAST